VLQFTGSVTSNDEVVHRIEEEAADVAIYLLHLIRISNIQPHVLSNLRHIQEFKAPVTT